MTEVHLTGQLDEDVRRVLQHDTVRLIPTQRHHSGRGQIAQLELQWTKPSQTTPHGRIRVRLREESSSHRRTQTEATIRMRLRRVWPRAHVEFSSLSHHLQPRAATASNGQGGTDKTPPPLRVVELPLQMQAMAEGSAVEWKTRDELEDYIGMTRELKSPFTLFARRVDLELPDPNPWMPFLAYSVPYDKIALFGRYQPSTGRLEVDREDMCRQQPGQLNKMLAAWSKAGYEYGANLVVDRTASVRGEEMTHHEFLTFHTTTTPGAGVTTVAGGAEDDAAAEAEVERLLRKRYGVDAMEAWSIARRQEVLRHLRSNAQRYADMTFLTEPQYRALKAWLAYEDDQLDWDDMVRVGGNANVEQEVMDRFRLGSDAFPRPLADPLEDPIEYRREWDAFVQRVRDGVRLYEQWANRIDATPASVRSRTGIQRMKALADAFYEHIGHGRIVNQVPSMRPCPAPDQCADEPDELNLCVLYHPNALDPVGPEAIASSLV